MWEVKQVALESAISISLSLILLRSMSDTLQEAHARFALPWVTYNFTEEQNK